MASKLHTDRTQVVRSLTSSIDENGEEVAARIEEEIFPEGVPPNLTVAIFVAALAAAAQREVDGLGTADIELAKELTDDEGYRDERDDATDDARVVVQRGRAAMVAGYGEAAPAKVGLDGEMPRDAPQLAQVAKTSADLVESAELGEPVLPTDRAAVAAQLRAAGARVDRSLADVSREEREAQTLRRKRDEQDAKVRRLYGGFADAFAGLAAAAGLHEVARRVRPTTRRRAGLPEEEDVVVTDPVVVDPNS